MEIIQEELLQNKLLALLNEDTNIDSKNYALSASVPFSYSRLLENFVHLEFTENDAIVHWKKIIENSTILKEKLGRKIGIHLAIVDYFTRINHLLSAPILIEIHAFRQTEKLAMIDGLTGLYNRTYMDIVLKKEFCRCERYSKKLSICLLDIDNFKKVNDTYGHLFGDTVLKELALLLMELIREADVACRYGGEEFLIILPETDAEGTQFLAERIREEIKKRPFFKENNITISGGSATYPENARDIEDLLNAADRALYRAKRFGKDQIQRADPDRRKFGRFAHSGSLEIFPKKMHKPISGILTKNISLGGIQFTCPISYTINTPLQLVFPNENSALPIMKAEGRISWVKQLSESFTYGVSFIETSETFEKTFVSQLPPHSKA